ncbi:MAG: sensor domain-containing diguanylate cyclase [Nitrospirae bacterium]|nr:sensor domain-containing diguanylate cyclase [Nitrospirota bacterium]
MKHHGKENELAEKDREISSLKLQLEEVRKLAAINERLLLASIREQERLLNELSKRSELIMKKGLEIRELQAFNDIIAAASKHLYIKDILENSLKVIIGSLESLEKAVGRKVKTTGGIFLVDEDAGELVHYTSFGISADDLGCKGRIPVGECICGMVAQTGEVDIIPYCKASLHQESMQPVCMEEDHAHVSIPLKSGNKVLGLIYLYFVPPGYLQLASDATIFTSIGNYLGLRIEKARLYEKVQELAILDGLTGLYNYREFHNRLEHEFKRAKRYKKTLPLLMIDIDHFKRFNDTYGHMAGDEVLRTIGRLIKNLVRNVDIPARYGGEEFAVILPETSPEQAEVVAERLRSSVSSHPFSIEDRTVSLTISLGLASFPEDADTKEGLVKAADRALYCAKSGGRNRTYRFNRGKRPCRKVTRVKQE